MLGVDQKEEKELQLPRQSCAMQSSLHLRASPGAIQPHSRAVRAAPIPLHGTHCSVDNTGRPEALTAANGDGQHTASGKSVPFLSFLFAPIAAYFNSGCLPPGPQHKAACTQPVPASSLYAMPESTEDAGRGGVGHRVENRTAANTTLLLGVEPPLHRPGLCSLRVLRSQINATA